MREMKVVEVSVKRAIKIVEVSVDKKRDENS